MWTIQCKTLAVPIVDVLMRGQSILPIIPEFFEYDHVSLGDAEHDKAVVYPKPLVVHIVYVIGVAKELASERKSIRTAESLAGCQKGSVKRPEKLHMPHTSFEFTFEMSHIFIGMVSRRRGERGEGRFDMELWCVSEHPLRRRVAIGPSGKRQAIVVCFAGISVV